MSFIRTLVGAFAPSSIHSLMSVTSLELSGSSVFGGMIGFFCREQNRNRLLSADLPATTATPRFPPLMTAACVPMSNLPSVTLPEWHTKHLFSKIGSTSLLYSTGSLSLRSVVGIGGNSSFFGSSFFSWACAAAHVRSAASSRYRIGASSWRAGGVSPLMDS